jgi:hypothetical protein
MYSIYQTKEELMELGMDDLPDNLNDEDCYLGMYYCHDCKRVDDPGSEKYMTKEQLKRHHAMLNEK